MNATNMASFSSHNFLRFVTLLVPPSCEEGNLDVDECAILVHQQLLNDSVKNILDGCMLDAAIGCHISACTCKWIGHG